ncbi:MAG: multifunctional CCA tRNA nucleotidyl transferase/2'3'-cyclic phosphodiesterase/2'nucleotidase/phosphatase [Thiogranum sp.]|jgi:tRNA nucleotidyltransferase (CCA-adding enzyme)
MDVFLVGGAVRDRLLGLPVGERDWVVVGATPQQMLDLGYRQVGKDFPVFLHPESKEEYALARTERKIAPGYKGFEFHADPGVTLEEDLMRRDLTINAMAENADGELIDPYGGQEDLAAGRLRHVSPAFAEDPVRILRVARFAARFGQWGFSVAHSTNTLMRKMVANGEVDYLVPERVWAEVAKALACDRPERFFTVLHGCGALAVLFPEIEREYADDQTGHEHPGLPPALARLQQSARQTDDPRVRFATLVLSLGEDLDTMQRLAQAETLCKRFRIPNDYTRLALLAIRMAEHIARNDAGSALDIMEASGAFRDTNRWNQLLDVYACCGRIDRSRAALLENARLNAAAIGATDVDGATLDGPAIGQAIREKRLQAIAQVVAGAQS